MKLTTIVVEDEQHCIDRLVKLLKKHGPFIEVLVIVKSVEHALKAINENKPDLVFLDIQLGNETSFELLKKIPNKDFEIIFTTAYDNFAVNAFKHSAIDYLLKPVQEDELNGAIHKLINKNSIKENNERLEILLHNINANQEVQKKISIPSVSGMSFVNISQIIHCQSDGGYTSIALDSKVKLVATKPLKYFEDLLSKDLFFRVHKSHLINKNHILEFKKSSGGVVVLSNDTEVGVAIRRKDDFLKWMVL